MSVWVVLLVSGTMKQYPAPVSSDRLIVIATGKAAIVHDDKASARELARSLALKTAVEEAIGFYVTSRTETENFALAYSRVVASAGGLAQVLRTLSEEITAESISVTLEVVVSPIPLREMLKHNGLMREWRIMVIMPETHIRRKVPDPAGETEFIRQFSEAGFKVMDPATHANLRNSEAAIFKSAGERRKLMRNTGADILIIGEAFSESAQDASGGLMRGLAACNARVEARAVTSDTGEIFFADALNSRVPALHSSELVAGKKAIQETARDLAPKFIQKLIFRLAGMQRPMTLIIEGIADAQQASRFEAKLSGLQGVRRIRREHYAQGELVVEMDIPAMMAESLATRLPASIDGTKIRIVGAAKHMIRMTAR